MSVLWNFHTHTDLVDGLHSAEEMVKAAIALGFTGLGFSEHAHTRFDAACGMTHSQTQAYIQQIRSLQAQWEGRLSVFLGLEIDSCDPQDSSSLDYCIGSVHWLKKDGVYYAVDDTPEAFTRCIEAFGGGIETAVAYYQAVAEAAEQMRPDILGHIDLVCKFNGTGEFFDEEDVRYQKAALMALDAALDAGCIVEVNTGGMARGWRKNPYPAVFLLKRALERKAPLILASDAHNARQLNFAFTETEELLRELGAKEIMNFNGTFFPVAL